jgi:hypothetical protein
LLQALSVIYGSDTRQSQNQHYLEIPAAPIERPQELEFNEVRIARVEEWRRFPLETQEQQQNWMRNKLATTQTPTRLSSEGHQEEPPNPTSGPRKRVQYQATGSARKRQKTASEGRETLNFGADYEPKFTVSTASPSTRLPASEMNDGWTASTLHNNPLSAPPEAARSYPQNQHATIRSPALHSTAATSHNNISNTPGGEQETQREQYTSKAKRLVTLHSRKYF